MLTRHERCPEHGSPTSEQSCIYAPYHMVFSRRLTDTEWAKLGDRINEAWTGDTWDVECVAWLVHEVTGDVGVVRFDPQGCLGCNSTTEEDDDGQG